MTRKDAIKYLQQLYPNGGHCWLDEQRIEAIGMAVKSLQEEPVSEDLEKEMDIYLASVFSEDMDGGEPRFTTWFGALRKTAIHFANWQKEQMMKDAVDAYISDEITSKSLRFDSDAFMAAWNKYEAGTKLKLIIVKD